MIFGCIAKSFTFAHRCGKMRLDELCYMLWSLDDVVIGDYATFHVEEAHDDLLGGWAVAIDSFISDRVLRKIDEFNRTAALNATAKKPYKPIEISEEGLELIEFLSLDCIAAEGEWHSDAEIKIDKNGYVILNGTKTKQFWDGKSAPINCLSA